MLTIEELYNMVTPDNYIEDGNYIYFYGKDKRFGFDLLCRVEIKHQKTYCVNKSGKMIFLSSEELMKDYIERKQNNIRGYKTMKIGYIEDRYYGGNIEYCITMNDGSKNWWTDRENNAITPKINEIRKYIREKSTEFVKVA